ncbi:MAG: tetratricopeptide repeat protein [Bacteroidia bacterium]
MIRNYKIQAYLLLFVITGLSCNPNRERWINKKWHSLTGHYNVYFNGEQKLNDVITQIEKSHTDDFTKVLDVYQVGTEQSAKAAGNMIDEAIKKFSATIQLHTVGSYTDDAYFKIAEARFYKQDFFAALENFQYVNSKYKHLGYEPITTNWIARCYLGLKKPTEAEAIMGLLLNKKPFAKKDIAPIYATAAEVNIQLQKYAPAAENLEMALKGNLPKNKKIRYHFILGQLYALNDNKPKAAAHFNKVIRFTPPYDFEFNALINLTRLYNLNDKKNVAKVRRNLKRMAADFKNIDYLDQIYYELGKLEMIAKNYNQGVDYFKKSANASTKNRNQKSLSYYELAKFYFKTKSYEYAKAYYDSTVQFLDTKHKDYESISKTKGVLTELITNLTVFETEDSLQRLSLLSKQALEQKIDSWIAEKKRKDELAAKQAKKQKQIQESITQNQFGLPSTNVGNFTPGTDGAWYFYNAQLVSTGQADFFSGRKWGQRKNTDFWRIEAKEKPADADDEPKTKQTNNAGADTSITKPIAKEIKSEIATEQLTGNKEKDSWIANVPYTQAQKKRSNDRMLEALNNIGKIYYNKLNESKECINYYTIMQNRFPASDYEPDAFYFIYKSHNDLNQTAEAEKYKKALITTYPEHPYSMLVQNIMPKTEENTANKELLAMYATMFENYKTGNYLQALKVKNNADLQFPGNSLRAKFELLAALCKAKTEGKESYKNALTDITKEYAGSPEAIEATKLLAALNKLEKKQTIQSEEEKGNLPDFDVSTDVAHYFLFGIKSPKSDFTEYNTHFTQYNMDYASNDNLRSNAMASNEGYQFILVREFANFAKAYDYYKGVMAVKLIENKLKIEGPYICYVISSNNFRKVLKENKLEAFETFFKKQIKAEKTQ